MTAEIIEAVMKKSGTDKPLATAKKVVRTKVETTDASPRVLKPRVTKAEMMDTIEAFETRGEVYSLRSIQNTLGRGSFTTLVPMLNNIEQAFRDGENRFYATHWKGCIVDRVTRHVWQCWPNGRSGFGIPAVHLDAFEVPEAAELYGILRAVKTADPVRGLAPELFQIDEKILIETATPVSGRPGATTLKVNPRTGEVLATVPKGFAVEVFLCAKELPQGAVKRRG